MFSGKASSALIAASADDSARSASARAASVTRCGSPVSPTRRSTIAARVSAGLPGALMILRWLLVDRHCSSRRLHVADDGVHGALLDRIDRGAVVGGDGLAAELDGDLRQRAVHVGKQRLLDDDVEAVLL